MTSHQIWSIVFIAGAVQGIFLSIMLARGSGSGHLARRLLAALLSVFSLQMLEEYVEVAGLHDELPHVLLSTSTLPLLIGPLLLLGSMVAAGRKTRFQRSDAWHGLPFVIGTLSLVPFYALPGPEKVSALADGSMTAHVLALSFLKAAHLLVYFFSSFRIASSAWSRKAQFSPVERRRLAVFRRGLMALVTIAVVSAVLYYGSFFWRDLVDADYVTFLLLTGVFFGWATIAIREPRALGFGGEAAAVRAPSLTGKSGFIDGPSAGMSTAVPYRGSSLSPGAITAGVDRLKEVMEREKPHLRPELRRADLAEMVQVPPHHLTQIMNVGLRIRYTDYVNGYRIAEFKERLRRGEAGGKTLLALALESGFSSKSTFNRVFRNETGMTPEQYRAGLENEGPDL